MTPFHRALQHTPAAEGWYTDSGPTYRGIDRRYWPKWEGWAIIDISEEEFYVAVARLGLSLAYDELLPDAG